MKPPWNLVIADDEPNIRNNLQLLFPWEDLNISVVFLASNGQEVLDYMKNNPVDIILADIQMPVMDGLMLTRLLKEKYSNVTIVLLSAFANFEYARSALRYGASAYLTKPVSYTELTDTFCRITNSDLGTSPVSADSLQDSQTENAAEIYKGYYNEIVNHIQEYVKENVSTASLIGAAELTGLSPSYVSTIFHRCFGKTFSDYLTGARMKEAAQLLEEGGSIQEVSWKVGYNNPKNFVRAFKQYTGADPDLLNLRR
ncbi:response regulator transcription factor [Lacrimispora sp.]|uniref:response regulator transcription factor n=1 Tax=Lacrimispora sp. TaxID=2719234 RepID=UPI0028B256A7|nr:response regulator [Lacrimispora sp.]